MLSGANQLLTPRHFFFFSLPPPLNYVLYSSPRPRHVTSRSQLPPLANLDNEWVKADPSSKRNNVSFSRQTRINWNRSKQRLVSPPGGVRRKKESDYVALISRLALAFFVGCVRWMTTVRLTVDCSQANRPLIFTMQAYSFRYGKLVTNFDVFFLPCRFSLSPRFSLKRKMSSPGLAVKVHFEL